MSNARKISQLVVGTEVKISNVDSDINNNLTNIITRLDSDDAKLQSLSIAAAAASGVAGIADSDLKVVADLRNDLDSEILFVRNIALSYTNYLYNATAGQTTFTGNDANSVSLAYTAGSITVFLNGIKLEADDFTATDGTSIVLTQPAGLSSQLSILCPKLESNYIIPGVNWSSPTESILAPDGTINSMQYGNSTSLSDDGLYVITGAPFWAHPSYTQTGRAWIFYKSGGSYSIQQQLNIPTPKTYANYGFSVAMDANGNTCLVTGRAAGSNSAGEGYVYTRSGTTWSLQATLKGNDISGQSYFGMSSDISNDGNTITIGHLEHMGSSQRNGAVWIFTRSGSTWSSGFLYEDTTNVNGDDTSGWAVALANDSKDRIVYSVCAGAGQNSDRNAAYVLKESGGSWTEEDELESGNTNINYGYSCSISEDGSVAAVSDNHYAGESSEVKAGTVYIFNRSGTTWSLTQRLYSANQGAGYFFGESISLNGDGTIIAIGSSMQDSSPTTESTIEIWKVSGSTWSRDKTITNSTNTSSTNNRMSRSNSSIELNQEGSILSAGASGAGASSKTYIFTA
jgi:hypothetical protein